MSGAVYFGHRVQTKEVLSSVGRSPLSAKLAAYRESLALKWRLKLVEEGKIVRRCRLALCCTGCWWGNGSVRVIQLMDAAKSRPNTSDSGSFAFAF